MGKKTSAPQVAREASRREVKAFVLGDGHHGAGITGPINLKLEGWGDLNFGQKSSELCFRHRLFLDFYSQILG